jgi:hypothetical protein
VGNVDRNRRMFLVGFSAVLLSVIGLWVSSLSNMVLVLSNPGPEPPCRTPKRVCTYIPYPHWGTTWPNATWMALICTILFGVWIAISIWLLRRPVVSQAST